MGAVIIVVNEVGVFGAVDPTDSKIVIVIVFVVFIGTAESAR